MHGKSATVALIGAGGSAAAVLTAAERWGSARVQLYNRNMDRAHALAERFGAVVEVASSLDDALDGATLVVNATPIGLRDDEHPGPDRAAAVRLRRCSISSIARGRRRGCARRAQAGHRAADGEGMLVEQGALAFELWFGIEPDRNAMWRALH